jgi:hypothetical protein
LNERFLLGFGIIANAGKPFANGPIKQLGHLRILLPGAILERLHQVVVNSYCRSHNSIIASHPVMSRHQHSSRRDYGDRVGLDAGVIRAQ